MYSLASDRVSALQISENTPYRHLTTHYEEKYRVGWYFMHAAPRPCFNPELLQDIDQWFTCVRQEQDSEGGRDYRYLVLASDVDGVFNLGGDLNLFRSLIAAGDHDGLLDYAKACINVLYQNIVHLERDLTTISLVQGDALGGGFEAALSSNVLIAERGTRMGLPEILFNLFPGMGAYSLLSRRIGTGRAEQMILSGQLYSAEELYEMGVVDILAEKGEGELAVLEYIKRADRAANGYRAMREVRDICNTLDYRELLAITTVWVEAALRLGKRDLRMMERLVSRQNAK
ncbi:enoyl-CoA hydratase [Thiohalobacter sp. COW1]|uniref:crotonase/enoyl-CoA hydratase family protein n=1 Tax=Thiohalobacter sp. COW1 TaxID=2795687 RepID=UPI0019151798|nr:crotonase/enoyl-CoA hydratase family protein [Thiohalobacter sp. COW1]BCO30145.1 enoyl-CoA hydratase [Thiohalobacter sp. COW1]